MINIVLIVCTSISIIGFFLRIAERFDLWFKDKVHNFLKKDTERYLKNKS
jgi:hypothetical protein